MEQSGDQLKSARKRNIGLNYLSVNDWCGPISEQQWLWHRAIPIGHLTIIQAAQKVGKSTLVRNLIAAVLSGNEFLGRAVKQGDVVYLPIEESPSAVKKHLLALGVDDKARIVIPTILDEKCKSASQGRVIRDTETLAEVISEVKPVLVVIDPLTLFLKTTSLNSYDKVYQALEPLIQVAQEHGTAIVFLHHESKGASKGSNVGQRGMGSVALPAAVSSTISMVNRNGIRAIEIEGRDVLPFGEQPLTMDENGVITAGQSWDDFCADKYADAILEVLRNINEPFTMIELEMFVEGDVKQIKTAIYKLIERGEILHVEGKGVKGSPKKYGLPECSSTADENQTDPPVD